MSNFQPSRHGRRVIEEAIRSHGLVVKNVKYARPVMTGMGDGTGGWTVETSKGTFGGMRASDVVVAMNEVLGEPR